MSTSGLRGLSPSDRAARRPYRAATQAVLGGRYLSTLEHQSIRVWDGLDRVWCRNCDFRPVHTYGTPFHEKHLFGGEVLLAYVLYADTLLSISQNAVLFDRTYKTVYYAIRDVEAAISRGFPSIWARIQQTVFGPTEVDESGKVCRATKDKILHERAALVGDRRVEDVLDGRVATAIS